MPKRQKRKRDRNSCKPQGDSRERLEIGKSFEEIEKLRVILARDVEFAERVESAD
jgi:hypothetical protein